MENKNRKLFLLIIAGIVTALMSFCFLYKPIYYRIYPFDRIKGYIRIIIDKQTLSPESISFHNKSRCDDISFKTKDNESYVSIKGGEYGEYSFTIDIPEINKPVEVCVFQANWWNTTDFALSVIIDTVNNQVWYEYYFSNNGYKFGASGNGMNNLDDEKLSVSLSL